MNDKKHEGLIMGSADLPVECNRRQREVSPKGIVRVGERFVPLDKNALKLVDMGVSGVAILLEPEEVPEANRNVYLLKKPVLVWQIEEFPWKKTAPHHYTNLSRKGDKLMAHNVLGLVCEVDMKTGDLVTLGTLRLGNW